MCGKHVREHRVHRFSAAQFRRRAPDSVVVPHLAGDVMGPNRLRFRLYNSPGNTRASAENFLTIKSSSLSEKCVPNSS